MRQHEPLITNCAQLRPRQRASINLLLLSLRALFSCRVVLRCSPCRDDSVSSFRNHTDPVPVNEFSAFPTGHEQRDHGRQKYAGERVMHGLVKSGSALQSSS
jgi:hypothetical protein